MARDVDYSTAVFNCCRVTGLPIPHREHKFAAPERQFRFDFAWIPAKVALEIEGGFYSAKSGHTSITGRRRDFEKYNLAAEKGWRLFRCTPQDVGNLALYRQIQRALNQHSPEEL